MSPTLKLNVQKRSLLGRKVKQLRRKQQLPGNIYGKATKSLAVVIPLKEFQSILSQAGETGIVELAVDKETKPRPVLIHNVQRDPVSDGFLHVDFHQVDLTQKVTVSVPIELTGESPAVTKGGVLVRLLSEIEVEALPKDLPDKFVVDITRLEEVGQGISLKEVPIEAAKVKLTAENLDELVVKVEAPAKEEEVAPAPAAEAETPAEGGEAKEAEAETPAETKATDKPAGGKEEPKQKPDQGKKPDSKKS